MIGGTTGVLKGDIRSLDYGSYLRSKAAHGFVDFRALWRGFHFILGGPGRDHLREQPQL